MKLVYDLEAKARVFFRFTFSFPVYFALSADLVEPVARHCIQQHKIKHDARGFCRGIALHLLRRVCPFIFSNPNDELSGRDRHEPIREM